MRQGEIINKKEENEKVLPGRRTYCYALRCTVGWETGIPQSHWSCPLLSLTAGWKDLDRTSKCRRHPCIWGIPWGYFGYLHVHTNKHTGPIYHKASDRAEERQPDETSCQSILKEKEYQSCKRKIWFECVAISLEALRSTNTMNPITRFLYSSRLNIF